MSAFGEAMQNMQRMEEVQKELDTVGDDMNRCSKRAAMSRAVTADCHCVSGCPVLSSPHNCVCFSIHRASTSIIFRLWQHLL